MILLIDNYDSFSYNLYQLVGELDADIKVIRNDALTVEEINALNPQKIILSPGPGRPEDAGIIISVVKNLGGKIPILGDLPILGALFRNHHNSKSESELIIFLTAHVLSGTEEKNEILSD